MLGRKTWPGDQVFDLLKSIVDNLHMKIKDFEDPELEHIEGSEIAAALDVSTYGTDKVFRPIYLNQDDQIIALTPGDARRLLNFLKKATKFLNEFEKRTLQ